MGYQKGDAIALVMENRVEYAAIWLGLSKVTLKTTNSTFKSRISVKIRKIHYTNTDWSHHSFNQYKFTTTAAETLLRSYHM